MEKNKFLMSYFKAPITNTIPQCTKSLFDVYLLVKSRQMEPQTTALRNLTDEKARREYKCSHFDYVTPGGVFTYHRDDALVEHSQIVCIDLDKLDNRLDEIREKLIADSMLTTLLLFRSPSGNGLKWFVEIDLSRSDHSTWFNAIRNYLIATYGLSEKQVDKSCVNPSKACFLCYDPDVYIQTEYIEFF